MSRAIVWFRQDLRIEDNPALAHACANHESLVCLYILENEPTAHLGGAQRWWLHHSLAALGDRLKQHGLKLTLKSGDSNTVLQAMIDEHDIDSVYWNRLYEPAHIERDKQIKTALTDADIHVRSYNASLLNEPWTIKNKSGDYFKVFTPFWKHCVNEMTVAEAQDVTVWPKIIRTTSEQLSDWALCPSRPDWASGFSTYWQPGESGAWRALQLFVDEHVNSYKAARDIPASMATSRLSPHLHFGEISPAQIWRVMNDVRQDPDVNQNTVTSFLSEIGWREFSYHLLYHFPALPSENFRSEFDAFPWQDDDKALHAWQKGCTGYPIVDAGMRELWQTGYMHNRVRMIVASFLTKDLLIDWRKGAAWFDDTLLDADLANNYAGWQWTAGCGADAAPYFRIFNPVLQGEKFDPHGDYVRHFVPELADVPNKWLHKPWEAPDSELSITIGQNYPRPIVDHSLARKKALQYYKDVKK